MAGRLQEPGPPRSLKPSQFNARLDFAKLLDKIVAVFTSRQRFYIRTDSASQIDQAFFECRAVIALMAQHTFLQFNSVRWRRWNGPGAEAGLAPGPPGGNVTGAASGVQLQADHIQSGGTVLFCSLLKNSPSRRRSGFAFAELHRSSLQHAAQRCDPVLVHGLAIETALLPVQLQASRLGDILRIDARPDVGVDVAYFGFDLFLREALTVRCDHQFVCEALNALASAPGG
jgi:hypothetical protein